MNKPFSFRTLSGTLGSRLHPSGDIGPTVVGSSDLLWIVEIMNSLDVCGHSMGIDYEHVCESATLDKSVREGAGMNDMEIDVWGWHDLVANPAIVSVSLVDSDTFTWLMPVSEFLTLKNLLCRWRLTRKTTALEVRVFDVGHDTIDKWAALQDD